MTTRNRLGASARGTARVPPQASAPTLFYQTVEDEGIVLPQQPILDFVGSGVTATNDGPGTRTVVTIPGASSPFYQTVQDEGVALARQPILDFVGGGVTATNDGPGTRTVVTIPLPSYQTVQDEGVALAQQPILDFVGGGVTATNDGPGTRTVVTIPLPSYQTIQNAGVDLPAEPKINFAGPLVAADNAGVATNITINTVSNLTSGVVPALTVNNGVLVANGTHTAVSTALLLDANVDAAAAVQGTKISPIFGSQTGVFGTTVAAVEPTGSVVSVGDGVTGAFVASRLSSLPLGDLANISIRRSRGTIAAPNAVLQNTFIGQYRFEAYDGASYQNFAHIEGFVDGAVAAGTVPIAMRFYTGTTAAVQQMSIASSGTVALNGPVLSFAGNSSGSVGQPIATTGAIRTAHAVQWEGRNSGNSADRQVLSWGAQTADVLHLGENGIASVRMNCGTNIAMQVAGANMVFADSGQILLGVANLRFNVVLDSTLEVLASSNSAATVAKNLSLKGQGNTGNGTNSSTGGKLRLLGGLGAQSVATAAAVGGDVFLGLQGPTGGNTNTWGNITVGTENTTWNTMQLGYFFANSLAAPTGNPTAGGYKYFSGGAEIYRGSGGTITTEGPA